ncbi:hypothetical protein [Sulfurimonas indica]|uniref:hypothetical protein n=1 Tax=Sulfurimonas indica TaxID=2508707 RepID=UPI001FE59C8C|nr:hypothetical protein [Sulfurimonas indica]
MCSLFLAATFALLLTLFIYMKQGFPPVDEEIMGALFDVWKFWFAIALNMAVLIALFRSVKYLFNHPHAGYVLKLKKCFKEDSHEYLEVIGYGDLVKVWRKWFMLLIWLVGSLMVLALLFTYIFSFYESLFDWFNIYVLYAFILLAGYLSFIFLGSRCKSVRIVKC